MLKRRRALLAALAVYITACCMPAAATTSDGDMQGGLMLLLGGLSFFDCTHPDWPGYSWLANPFFLAALPTGRWPAVQRAFALVALGLSALFLGAKEIIVNEGGGYLPVRPAAGYFVWVAAMVVLNLFAWLPKAPPKD